VGAGGRGMNRFRCTAALATALGCLSIAGLALAATPTGYYTGETGQKIAGKLVGGRIDMYVNNGVITQVTYEIYYKGNAACAHFDEYPTRLTTKIAIHGKSFHGAPIPNGSGDTISNFEGKFSGTTVNGTFTEKFSTYDPQLHKAIRCTSGETAFRVKKGGAPL
jgi:hypothetical protein